MKHKVISSVQHSPNIQKLVCERLNVLFEPGNCIDVLNPLSGNKKPYSIASSPTDEFLEFFIKVIPSESGVSQYITTLKPGDEIELSAPFGFFTPGKNEIDRKYVYIATGTGIAPFRSAMRYYKHSPVMVLYGVRRYEELILSFTETFLYKYNIAVSQQPQLCFPKYISEFYHKLPTSNPEEYNYYVCGLESMISECTQYLTNKGVPWNKIFIEQFYF